MQMHFKNIKSFKVYLIFTFFIIFSGIAAQTKTHHDLSCFKNAVNQMESVEKDVFNVLSPDVKVSKDDELQVGNAVFQEMQKKYTFISSGESYEKLNQILRNLIAQISSFQNPSTHPLFGKYVEQYKIYLIQSEEINAFTAGAKIFVTTGIFNFCKNNDELACIIGHEISHNELGHIYEKVKRQKASQIMFGGGLGNLAYFAASLMTTPFNQLNEGHCDFFGIDLAEAAGYNGCSTVSLWRRMSEKSGEKNFLDLFSSHPYSGDRSECCKKHIRNNYEKSCAE